MAVTQGKNDRTFLYWNDKNIKREKLFQLLSSFHSSGQYWGAPPHRGLWVISTIYEITPNEIPKRRCGHSPHSAQTKQYYYMTTTLQVNKDTLGSTLKSIGNQYGDTVVLYDDYKQHE